MDCVKSLELLSEFSAGTLEENDQVLIRTHLSACVDCDGVLKDLVAIVDAAKALRIANGLTFPNEDSIWQRMHLGENPVH